MKFSFALSLEKREGGDLLILPFWEELDEAADFSSLKELYVPVLKSGDFKAKVGESYLRYPTAGKETRIMLLGLGKKGKVTEESLRRAYANAARVANSKKGRSIAVVFPEAKDLSVDSCLKGIAEGLLLANYAFDHLKHDTLKEKPTSLFEKIEWIGVDKKEEPALNRLMTICAGVYFVRELVNGNADDVTPQMLADTAQAMEKKYPALKTTIFDKKKIEEEKMGLLLAVNRGSHRDPFFIQVAYKGDPSSKEHFVFVGKGVTYDTGGLNLKVGDGMLTMKCDMGGSAVVLGLVQTVAALGLKVNITAVVPTTENSIDSKSYKMGDVYRSYSGKTVEITNTDAEGRLILADAISYAIKNLEPTAVIDLATLTGAVVIALGEEIAGLFSNDDALSEGLMGASKDTGELICRLPLHLSYKEAYKSEFADMTNASGRDASAIKAALFLHEFVGDMAWAHLDIAGTAFLSKPKFYNTTKASGFGLRLLIDFLEKKSSP